MIRNKSIRVCLIGSSLVVLKMVTGSNLFLAGFLMLIVYGMLKEDNDSRINFLLFFVSWTYAIKLNLHQFSLMVPLSFIYFAIALSHLWICRRKIPRSLIFAQVLFLTYILISLFSGVHNSAFQILNFVFRNFVIIVASLSVTKKTSYAGYFFHYSLGLLVGSIVRALGYAIPAIYSFILSMGRINTVLSDGSVVTRFAGLDIDPNYYATQIVLAVTLNLLIIFTVHERRKTNIIVTLALAVFGLLSFSKMYVITLFILTLLVFIVLLSRSLRKAVKYLAAVIGFSCLLLYRYGGYFRNTYVVRFIGQGTNLASITTGRSLRWDAYIQNFLENTHTSLFGTGLGENFLNGELPHNMYLLAIYQIGIVGVILYIILLVYMYRAIRKNYMPLNKLKLFSLNIIPLLIVIITNFTLDSFIMDYFQIQLFLVMTALAINHNSNGYVSV